MFGKVPGFDLSQLGTLCRGFEQRAQLGEVLAHWRLDAGGAAVALLRARPLRPLMKRRHFQRQGIDVLRPEFSAVKHHIEECCLRELAHLHRVFDHAAHGAYCEI